MVTKLHLLPSVLFLIACSSHAADGPARAPSPGPIAAEVDALFAEWAKPDSPGCAVAVVRGGRVVHAKGYGMADLEHGVPITPRTVFYVGSVSKQFTAYAVVRLAQQGKLSLDDEARKYLPELHDFGKPVTIRQLIHHTSGLRDYFELFKLAGTREGDLITQKDLLGVIWKERELNFPPGERHQYSNSNYALLATIVERVTGEPFRDWMAHNVFAPLGMSQTLVCDDHQRIIKDRAWSYRSDPATKGAFKAVVFPYSGYGAGGIYSTVEDLARWESNLAKPRAGDERVIRQMLERGRLNSGQPINYAFALHVDEHRGMRRIGHTGSLAGYRAYLGFFPDQDLGVIVLSNLASFPPGKAMQLADLFLPKHVEKTPASNPVQGSAPSSTTKIQNAAAREPELEALQGSWSTETLLVEGSPYLVPMVAGVSPDLRNHPLLSPRFRGDQWLEVEREGNVTKPFCTVRLEPSSTPKGIDLVGPRGVIRGIYRREGDVLTLYLNADPSDRDRPKEFDAGPRTRTILVVCKRLDRAAAVIAAASSVKSDTTENSGLPELDVGTLERASATDLQKLERIYNDQLQTCDRTASLERYFSRRFESIEPTLKSDTIAMFDRWCGRDQGSSLSAIPGATTNAFKRRSDSYEVKAAKLRKQLTAIRQQQVKIAIKADKR
jgi:uncharacterized protein (TIGR03067 family)